MKKAILLIIGVLLIALYAITVQHQRIEVEWGKRKEQTLDGAHPETPGTCVYCEYIRPLFEKNRQNTTIMGTGD